MKVGIGTGALIFGVGMLSGLIATFVLVCVESVMIKNEEKAQLKVVM